jgi:3-oxoacyl-[acyl-carrier protein] reductase
MESLSGKNALITGSGKGIGRAIAMALAREGVNVGLLSRTENDLQQVAAEIRPFGVKTSVATADVADINAVNNAVEKVQSDLGFIHILINNAGMFSFGGFLQLEPAEWERIIKVNLLGVYYVTRAVLPAMIDKQTGDIVNISSTAGQRGSVDTSAYSASKFGLNGLSESLMLELRKHNVRVNLLTPSTIDTENAIAKKITDGNPEKVTQPEDFAELVVAGLKLNRRTFIKEAGLWSTNP